MNKKSWAAPEIETLDLTMTSNSYKKDEAPDGETFWAGNQELDHRGLCECS